MDKTINEDRVMGFSDAVFAFAATLLVLKIDLPGLTAGQLSNSTQFIDIFKDLWPQYLANIISFIVIGYYWINHHAIFSMVKNFNMPIVWLNLAFLICVSFLPFPVDLYGENLGNPLVVVFYSASLAAVGYMLFILWWYVSRSLTDKGAIRYHTLRYLVAPLVFTISIPLVYVHPLLAQVCWILIIFGNLAVEKIFKAKHE